ncbi:hypothetical protein BKA65DRAFT_545147 [Rhexocercosporidium sp. MPI-PUGE-AT-0058]|nr:hypothetical protein BKA65DRAFT_545147 [Rhexocercosporidium sp. MPI-PUGE-AT-0058]
MAECLPPYIYEPLPARHIRVLSPTLPPDEGQQITWSLSLMHLSEDGSDDALGYEALSYTWGELFYNLFNRLRRETAASTPQSIRGLTIPRTTSIIYAFIRLMSKIYKRASRVWVWLGPVEEPGATEAVELILPQMERLEYLMKMRAEDETLNLDHLKDLRLPPVKSPAWPTLQRILSHPWYRRLWIAQECPLAREVEVLVGRHVVAWKTLADALKPARHLTRATIASTKLLVGEFETKRKVFACRERYQANIRNFFSHLVSFCDLVLLQFCTDPRDRVLGLEGILDEPGSSFNFDEEISLADLYCKFMQSILHRPEALWLSWWSLFSSAIPKQAHSDLPSWCPDLHHTRLLRDRSISGLEPDEYRVSRKERRTMEGRNLREIIIHATVIDSVDQLGQVFDVSVDETLLGILSAMAKIHEWESQANNLFDPVRRELEDQFPGGRKETTAAVQKIYWNTLSGNVTITERRATKLTPNDFLNFMSHLAAILKPCQALDIDIYDTLLGPHNADAWAKFLDRSTEAEIEPLQEKITELNEALTKFYGDQKARAAFTQLRFVQQNHRIFTSTGKRFGFL